VSASLQLNSDLVAIPDLEERLRKLRWFVSAFKVHTSLVEHETGLELTLDEGALNRVFFTWTDSLDWSKQGAATDRADFIVFAAGLALRALVQHDPAHAGRHRRSARNGAPVVATDLAFDPELWPSGYLYVTFCLSVLAALEVQRFGDVVSRMEEDVRDTVFWGSLCENVSADSHLAIPYLDRLLGRQPNWDRPDAVMERPAMIAASVGGAGDGAGTR